MYPIKFTGKGIFLMVIISHVKVGWVIVGWGCKIQKKKVTIINGEMIQVVKWDSKVRSGFRWQLHLGLSLRDGQTSSIEMWLAAAESTASALVHFRHNRRLVLWAVSICLIKVRNETRSGGCRTLPNRVICISWNKTVTAIMERRGILFKLHTDTDGSKKNFFTRSSRKKNYAPLNNREIRSIGLRKTTCPICFPDHWAARQVIKLGFKKAIGCLTETTSEPAVRY